MKKSLLLVALASLATAVLLPAYGKAPAKLDEVAPVEDLAAEANDKLAELEEYLKDQQTWTEGRETKVVQHAGVLAVVGQAIAEHPHKDKVKINGPALRDAAIAIYKAQSFDDAKAAFERARRAAAGEAEGNAAVEHDWAKLINMHGLMAEVNYRNARLRRAVIRPRNPADSRHATMLAVLGLVIYSDTHEVKDKADLPKWHGHATDFRKAMLEAAAAVRNQDAAAGKVSFLNAQKACAACHKTFRVEAVMD